MGMRQRIGRRYDAVTKYLREAIADTTRGHRVRMQAALKLADILLEHDRAQARRELAELRSAARSAEAEPTATAPTPETEQPVSPADALREAQAFLERTRQKEAAVNGAR